MDLRPRKSHGWKFIKELASSVDPVHVDKTEHEEF